MTPEQEELVANCRAAMEAEGWRGDVLHEEEILFLADHFRAEFAPRVGSTVVVDARDGRGWFHELTGVVVSWEPSGQLHLGLPIESYSEPFPVGQDYRPVDTEPGGLARMAQGEASTPYTNLAEAREAAWQRVRALADQIDAETPIDPYAGCPLSEHGLYLELGGTGPPSSPGQPGQDATAAIRGGSLPPAEGA